jgi:tight adherence protein B
LERAAGAPAIWPQALAAARFGESIAEGLRRDAVQNPAIAAQLRQLSASWAVGAAHGSGLVGSVERLALSVQSQFELRSVLSSELAAPRATMRMLSALPLVGVGMGYLLGADPIGWFVGSSIGALVVMSAVALTIVGVMWTQRIVRRVDRAMARG